MRYNRYYILDSKEESDQCLEACLIAHFQNVQNDKYKAQTTSWAPEQKRLTDGKYIVPVCPSLGTFGYTIEASKPEWFEANEE